MASIIQEVTVNQGVHFQKIRELSSSHAYINIPIPVLTALEPLDCTSRCLWTALYQLGYFTGGAATITLESLAKKLQVSRSSLETKIRALVQNGFLIKQNNFDEERHQYLASTFHVRLPDNTIDAIAKLPTRKDTLNEVGIYITKDFQKDAPISAPAEAIQEQVMNDELGAIRAAKAEVESKLAELERTGSPGPVRLAATMELTAQLRSLAKREEKILAPELPTSPPSKKVGSPNGCESNNNISRTIDRRDNNKQTSTVAAPSKTDIQRLSTANCYFATQAVKEKKAGKGYLNTPVEIPEKIKAKIQSVVCDAEKMKTLANAKEVIAEAEFAVSRCFTGASIEHAANTFFKLLREGKWRTPIPMLIAEQNAMKVSDDLSVEGEI